MCWSTSPPFWGAFDARNVTPVAPLPAENDARQRGFTLVEVMVTLVVLSLIALMSWRALDTLVKSEQHTQQRASETQRLQTALAQWRADLDAMAAGSDAVAGMQWDGRVLRITRRPSASSSGGMQVVAWSLLAQSDGALAWVRWASAEITTHAQWRAAWDTALLIGRGEIDNPQSPPIALIPASAWQLFYHRNDAWTNPLSSADGSENAKEPDAVRLKLWPALPGLNDALTLDWVFAQHTRQRS
jgi:general secretion pathway protein J